MSENEIQEIMEYIKLKVKKTKKTG